MKATQLVSLHCLQCVPLSAKDTKRNKAHGITSSFHKGPLESCSSDNSFPLYVFIFTCSTRGKGMHCSVVAFSVEVLKSSVNIEFQEHETERLTKASSDFILLPNILVFSQILTKVLPINYKQSDIIHQIDAMWLYIYVNKQVDILLHDVVCTLSVFHILSSVVHSLYHCTNHSSSVKY